MDCMAWGWLGASSFLLVIAAVVTYIAMIRLNRSRFEPIGAEKMACDVLAQEARSSESTDIDSSFSNDERGPSRSGRLAIFGAGSLSLVLGLLFVAVAAFTNVSWAVPVCFVLVGFGSLALLRFWAVRDQRAQQERSVAYSAGIPSDHESGETVKRQDASTHSENPVSDAHSAGARVVKAKPVAASVKSLRYARTHRDFDRYENKANDLQRTATPERKVATSSTIDHRALQVEDNSWAPVQVPRPLYLDAEERFQHIELMELPEEPYARSKTLKEAASGSVRIDLDDVLNRRRA